MTGHPSRSEYQADEVEYVGAPTEFADADEVPEWVANIAKVLFFVPSALITATTVPFLVLGFVLACCVVLFACGSLASAF